MADNKVDEVPDDEFVGGLSSDNAVLLLAAAEELGLDQSVVRTSTDGEGGFYAPPEVVKKATASAKKAPPKSDDKE